MAYSGSALRNLRADGWEITETFHPEASTTDWHEHETGHFCLVVAGGLVDEGGNARRDCGPGTLLYFPPHVPHRDRFLERGARCLNLRPPGRTDSETPPDGRPDAMASGARSSSDSASVHGCVLVCDGRASWLASRMYDRIRIDGPRPRPSRAEFIDLLDAAAALEPDASALEPPCLSRARALIEENWADDARLGTIAERVGVSRFHLARRFRRRFGCSVGQYVQRLRVTRARHLLLATDASLSRIAFETGFADQSHFTRIFGRHVGASPARYRSAA